MPTVHDSDGLALSSSNAHPSPVGPPGSAAQWGARVDCLAVVDPVTLVGVPKDHRGPALLAVAARVGSTRLIDNAVVQFG